MVRPSLANAVLAVLVACGLLLGAPPARAGDPPRPAEVQKAIDAGAGFLRTTFAEGFTDETWHGPVEIVALTLAHCGSNLEDPVFAKAVEVAEKAEPRWTYRTALLAMALAEVNPRRYQAKIAHCAQWLVDTQLAGGEWGYPGTSEGAVRRPQGISVAPPPPPAGAKPGEGAPQDRVVIERRASETSDVAPTKGDFSNTQFAILGLRACREAGIEVPKATWTAALDYLKKFQRPDGGWGYVVAGTQDDASYSSLTCAGVCSLAICLHGLGTKNVRADPALKKGLAWLDKNLDPARNVGIDQSAVMGPSGWQHYHLYSLERAGRVLSVDVVGKRPWYADGARWLLAAQKADGRWADAEVGQARPAYLDVADTCFALLFLTRATRPITGP